jgi:serine/threonine protein kinase
MWSIKIGDLFDNRYRIRSKIGTGGMSYVFAAEDEELAETVALKIIKPEFAEDDEFVTRFKREVRIARQIRHPNVVQVLEFGRTSIAGTHLYYLTMELLKGEDLGAWLRAQKPAAMADVLRIGLQLCDALREAHGAGVIHRDIKPQNIFVEPREQIKLMDFGISRITSLPSVTQGGKLIGTPRYMSPEQVHGRVSPDHRSDLYSVGVVLYELSTRRKPFDGENTIEIAMKQLQEMPERPREVNPRVPSALDHCIMKCLEKEPSERYQSASELRSALESILTQPEAQSEKTVVGVETKGGSIRPLEVSPTVPDTTVPTESKRRSPTTVRTVAETVQRKSSSLRTVALSLAALVGVAVLVTGVYRWLSPSLPESQTSEAPREAVSEQPAVPPSSPPEETVGGPEAASSAETPTEAVTPTPSASIAPKTSPSPKERPPRPTPRGQLHVDSSPSGAAVSIDGEKVGTTPWRGGLTQGEHRLQVSHPGYSPVNQRVMISAGETHEQSLLLTARPTNAEVSISANPDTEVYVDGELAGKIPPIVKLTLPTGRHTLRYVLPDYDEHTETVEVLPNRTNEFAHRFPLFGSVRIVAVPYAQVHLDGKDLGFTPVNLDKVPEGAYELTLTREGFQTIRESITVRPAEINRFQYTLVEQKP